MDRRSVLVLAALCLPGCFLMHDREDGGGADPRWCAGYDPPSPKAACGSDSECGAGAVCAPPDEAIGCRACYPPERPCEPVEGCAMPDGTGGFCVEYFAECTCGGELSTRCERYCGDDDDCGPGRRCAPSGARCYVPTCEGGGWDCGVNHTCEVGDPGADEHGCVRRACMLDGDCECGLCIEDRCHDGPGVCTLRES